MVRHPIRLSLCAVRGLSLTTKPRDVRTDRALLGHHLLEFFGLLFTEFAVISPLYKIKANGFEHGRTFKRGGGAAGSQNPSR